MPESLFISELDQIKAIFKQTDTIYLYDTVLISQHEKVYHETGQTLLSMFVGDAPIVVMEAVYNELLLANKSEDGLSERYLAYLAQFQQVIYLSEEHLFELLRYKFSKGMLPNMVKILKTVFKTRPTLTAKLEGTTFDSNETLLSIIHNDFEDGKDFGEYSLLWSAFVIQEIYANINCHFIGADNDLFGLYRSSYVQNNWPLSKKPIRKAWISSTETILAAALLEQADETIVHTYRNSHVAGRKLIYQEYFNGILSPQYQTKTFTNDKFIEEVKHKHVFIVY